MYCGGEAVYNTCMVCVTIERCIAYSGQLARRRTLLEWDRIIAFFHEHSRDFLSLFYELFPFP